jgi:hypothetical protein
MYKPTLPRAYADPPRADLGMTGFVAASTEEIKLAQELLRLIERRYLGRGAPPRPPSPYWGVVAD